MKQIFATNDKTKYTLVDDDIFEIIQDMGLKFCINKYGYFLSTSHIIKLPGMAKKKRLLLHHFVWILKTGNEPTRTIDHIDINPANNQFKNLRLASRREQSQHRGKMKNNKSGLIGVSHKHEVHKYNNKKYEKNYWLTQIHRQDGKREQKYFPYTDEGKIAAGKWYDDRAREYFGNFVGELNFPMPDDKQ